MFIYSPQFLLINTTPLEVVWLTITASIGIYAFSVAIQNQFILETNIAERLVMLISALLLIKPGIITDAIGFGGFALVYMLQRRRARAIMKASLEPALDPPQREQTDG
ncbi:MAG: hypothetical protein HY998_08615 [candidate division NC10 bacterium]|nr:hypothetical protein [candidate division NC10 bacterium]